MDGMQQAKNEFDKQTKNMVALQGILNSKINETITKPLANLSRNNWQDSKPIYLRAQPVVNSIQSLENTKKYQERAKKSEYLVVKPEAFEGLVKQGEHFVEVGSRLKTAMEKGDIRR